MSVALRVAALLAAIYLVIVFIAWLVQDTLAFPSPRHVLPEPADAGVPHGVRVAIRARDGVLLHGWYLPAAGVTGPAPALLWFTGNMETIGSVGPVLGALQPPGAALLAVDYRGYGENGGRASESAVYQDAEALWAWLTARPDVDAHRIAVYGRSVGSAPATWLAVHADPAALVLDSPFTSGRAMARYHYWFLPGFLRRLELDNLTRVRAARIPVLVLHGTEDRVAPFVMGEALAHAAPHGRLVPIPGAGHNETWTLGGTAYRDTLHAFLAEAFARHAP